MKIRNIFISYFILLTVGGVFADPLPAQNSSKATDVVLQAPSVEAVSMSPYLFGQIQDFLSSTKGFNSDHIPALLLGMDARIPSHLEALGGMAHNLGGDRFALQLKESGPAEWSSLNRKIETAFLSRESTVRLSEAIRNNPDLADIFSRYSPLLHDDVSRAVRDAQRMAQALNTGKPDVSIVGPVRLGASNLLGRAGSSGTDRYWLLEAQGRSNGARHEIVRDAVPPPAETLAPVKGAGQNFSSATIFGSISHSVSPAGRHFLATVLAFFVLLGMWGCGGGRPNLPNPSSPGTENPNPPNQNPNPPTNPNPTPPGNPTSGASGVLTPSVSSVNFGNVAVGAGTNNAVVLSNTGGSEASSVVINSIGVTGKSFGDAFSGAFPLTLAAGQSVSVTILFSPTAAGVAAGLLTISVAGSESPLMVPLSGTGIAGSGLFQVTPSTVNFGNVSVGGSQQQQVILSAANSGVTVSAPALSGQGFSISGAIFPLTLSAGQTVPLTITFTPQAAGDVSGSIVFLSNASNSSMTETLAGIGIQHTVSLSWNASTSTVAGYYVYRSITNGSGYIRLNPNAVSATSYIDNQVQGNATYFYVVTAVDSGGDESTYSNQASAAIPNY